MWFPMPILWSVLAISIAEELGVPAPPVGNAVEARVMLEVIAGPQDRRVRGAGMQGLKDSSFHNLRRRGTYVVQPIRMAMVQPPGRTRVRAGQPLRRVHAIALAESCWS